MRGVVSANGVACLKEDIPIPMPASGQLLLRVQTCGVNRLDLLQASGCYPAPRDAGPVLGVEVCGTIVAIGDQCSFDWVEGEQVAALVTGGGYGEFCSCDEATTWRNKWPELGLAQLASIPEAMMTAYQLLFFVAKLSRGESALLHAAASSIGCAMIQMACRKGVRVIATVRTAEKRDLCLRMGAEECLVLESPSFGDRIKGLTHGRGVDVVICPVGNAYFFENIESLAIDGRYTLYGSLSGTEKELGGTVLAKLLAKRIAILPSTLRGRSREYKAELARALTEDEDCGMSQIGDRDGCIRIKVDEVFPLEAFNEAHTKMARNSNVGKLVLTVTEVSGAIESFRSELSSVMERYK